MKPTTHETEKGFFESVNDTAKEIDAGKKITPKNKPLKMKLHIIKTLDPEKFFITKIDNAFLIFHLECAGAYINKRNKVRRFSTIEAALNLLKTQGIEYAKVYI